MKTNFTKGEWYVFHRGDTIAVMSDSTKIPVINWPGFDESFRPLKEHLANAKLVSCAPEMLTALCDVLSLARIKWGNLDNDANIIFENAEKLIRKATS